MEKKESLSAEDKLNWEFKITQALSELYKPLSEPDLTIENISSIILDVSKRLTGSIHGFVATIDPFSRNIICHTLTEMMQGECRIDKQFQNIIFPIGPDGKYSYLWGYALNSKKPFFTNSPSSHVSYKGLPPGHIAIDRFLSLPVLLRDELVGNISLANAPADYSEHDLEAIKMVAEYYALAIQRHRVEEKLLQHSYAVEQSPVSIVITNIEGNIQYVNKKFCELTGYSFDEVFGKKPSILKSGSQPDPFYKNLWDTIISGSIWQGEFHNKKKNGDLYWEWSSISPLRNIRGEITHFIALKEDITEKKRLEENLYSAKLAADNANRAKSEFLANMSHELRTPLNGIIGFCQLLTLEDMGSLTDAHKEYLGFIQESGNHLLAMVNDILDLSRIEAGKIEIEKKPFDITGMLERLPSTINSIARKKKIKIDVDISRELGWLNGDEVRIKEIVYNLLSNAIKFTGDGKRIGLSAREDGDKVMIRVWDEGHGIPHMYLEKIFEPFVRGVSGEKTENGTGLGLAISKSLVELHNGTITAESVPGQGSTFTISIPGRLPVSKTSSPVKKVEARTYIMKKSSSRILLVEDNMTNMQLIKNTLEPAGYEIIHAATGEIALEKINNEKFNIILMDILLPGISGVETMKKIRDIINKDVPIIAFTAFAMKGDREKYLDAGFDEYLAKPFELKQLSGMLEKFLDT